MRWTSVCWCCGKFEPRDALQLVERHSDAVKGIVEDLGAIIRAYEQIADKFVDPKLRSKTSLQHISREAPRTLVNATRVGKSKSDPVYSCRDHARLTSMQNTCFKNCEGSGGL